MNKRQYIALACLLAFAANAGAQTEYADSVQMEEFVVTGTRTLKVLAETPIQTRLISAKDIKESDATNISDLLQQEIPGVEFSYSMSQQVNMNMAGFSGQGVLFLIDGERLAGETMDNTDFQRIDMSNVERIEIVKGAASALYGSSANGGVINIITKDKQKSLFKINANARIAAHNEQRYGAGIGISKGMATNNLSVQHTRIDTYDVHSAEGGLSSNIVSSVYGGRTWNF
ncbi:MAG: TonB-dependent receptor, partial [Bacteroidaceae bacterium]|nr:TonB-dependent receptor [Bacteroidaceae bacterium]